MEAGHVEVVRHLVDKGANKEEKDCNHGAPLHWAVNNGHAAVVECLIEKGANKEARGCLNFTPLQLAVRQKNNTAVIKALIENGADVTAGVSSKFGEKTPLCLAVEGVR